MLARVLKVLVTAHLLGLSIPSCAVYARLEDGRFHGNMPRMPTVPVVRLGARASLPVTSINGSQLPAYNEVYYFDQLIDHNRPHLGTFKQRYWHTWEYYKPGEPSLKLWVVKTRSLNPPRWSNHPVDARGDECEL